MSRLGKMERRKNKDPKPTANKKYNIVEVICNDERVVLMLTDEELKTSLERGQKNVEDYPRKNWLQRLFS